MSASQINKYLKQLFIGIILLFFMIFIEYESRASLQDRNDRRLNSIDVKLSAVNDKFYIDELISRSYAWELEYKENITNSYLRVAGAAIESLQQQNKYVDSIINSHQ